MKMPGFSAELAFSEPAQPYRPASAQKTAREPLVAPQQVLIPPGTLVFTCSPCTWGPPMIQICCAQLCLPFGPCFPICFTRMAPLCPT